MVKSPAAREMIVNGVGLRFVSGCILLHNSKALIWTSFPSTFSVPGQHLPGIMVHLLHAPSLPGLGNLPASIRFPDAHHLDDTPKIPSHVQITFLLVVRPPPYEDVPPLPDQPGDLAKRLDCIEVREVLTQMRSIY